MRVPGALTHCQEVGRTVESPEAHAGPCERVGSPFSRSTTHTAARTTSPASKRCHGFGQRPTGRDDVFDETHDLAGVVGPSILFPVPYPLVSPRTMMKRSPDAMDAEASTRPLRAPVRRGGGAQAPPRVRPPPGAHRAPAAGRDRSRTGTCRGSTTTACRSGARSPPRAATERRAVGPGRRRSPVRRLCRAVETVRAGGQVHRRPKLANIGHSASRERSLRWARSARRAWQPRGRDENAPASRRFPARPPSESPDGHENRVVAETFVTRRAVRDRPFERPLHGQPCRRGRRRPSRTRTARDARGHRRAPPAFAPHRRRPSGRTRHPVCRPAPSPRSRSPRPPPTPPAARARGRTAPAAAFSS